MPGSGIAFTLNAMGEDIRIDGATVTVSGGSALPVVARRVSGVGLTGFECGRSGCRAASAGPYG